MSLCSKCAKEGAESTSHVCVWHGAALPSGPIVFGQSTCIQGHLMGPFDSGCKTCGEIAGLRTALAASEKARLELDAVVERMRDVLNTIPNLEDCCRSHAHNAECCLLDVGQDAINAALALSPASCLAEHDAGIWEEAAELVPTAYLWLQEKFRDKAAEALRKS